jgi:hypothetical protein
MLPRPFVPLLAVAAAFASAVTAAAHDLPFALNARPAAPPPLDPGPDAAVLRVRIIDAATREQTSATVSVNDGHYEPDQDPYREYSFRRSANRHVGSIRWRKVPYYVYTDGRFEVRVPPGPAVLEVRKGYEYRPVELTLATRAKETTDVEIVLERAIDMAALGWYSGDTHIHMTRTGDNDDTLLTLTSAKDIRYAYLLSMNVTGYDVGGPHYETFLQAKGLGDKTLARRGPYHITSGQEYRTFGRGQLGHVTIVLADDYVRASGVTDRTNRGPSLATIADQAHASRGFIGLNHGGYHNAEADRLLLERKMDFLELLQFGDYRSLGLEGWYDFLNIGYRLPIVGASDFPPTRELASEMTYVWSDDVPTPRTFVEGINAGRSFATSGPMLFLTVDGNKPGTILRYPEKTDAKLTVDIRVHSHQYPVRYLDLIVNGTVVERRFDPAGRSEWALRHVLPVRDSTWIVARAYGDAGTDAHTNPVYVYMGDALPVDAASARRIIARLEGSMAAIPIPEIVTRMGELKAELQNLIRDGRANLPLPAPRP